MRFLTVLKDGVEGVQVFLLSDPCATSLTDKEVIELAVAILVIEDALCLLLVTASSATFLHIPLQAFRHRIVNYEAYITLVDAHPKGNRSDYHLNIIIHPISLDFLPSGIRQLSMIKVALDTIVSLQVFSQLLTVLPRDAVDYSAFSLEATLEHSLYISFYIFNLLLVSDFIQKIWPVET